MLEKFIYTNSSNEMLEFGKDCLFVNENDLRDFAWEITSRNNKITGFNKGIVSKTIPVIIKCSTESEGVALRNRLFEVFEKDVLAEQYGKIHIGEYYLRCYITGSKKTQYLIHESYMQVSFTVQTDLPEWVKETTTVHRMNRVNAAAYLDYPYDFPHDFKNSLLKTSITNNNFIASNFILTISGQVANPTLYIGEHAYSVNVIVDTNEHLTIDSMNKTIVLVRADGTTKVNCFNNRNKDSYIFEKIPAGNHTISSPNDDLFFTLTLLDERSEPKWT